MTKKQPWFHSWYADFFGLHFLPFFFVIIALFELPPFGNSSLHLMGTFIALIIIVDWAHIFAQWYRIYSNPAESSFNKWFYPISYILLIPVIASIVHFSGRFPVERFFVYFVIYHFIKQHYGYTRIYSFADGIKSRGESFCETSLVYSTMVVPLIYWHITFPDKSFLWKLFFLESAFFELLIFPALMYYFFSLVGYAYFEYKRYQRTKFFNYPKTLAILSPALGWGIISLFPESKYLIYFSIVLTHDMSYSFFVWLIGRRDRKLLSNNVSWFSWSSIPGFFFYFAVIILVSQVILVVHHRYVGHSVPNPIFGDFFNFLVYSPGWKQDFGVALFFATQGHHYFIDRFLWKKEKDLNYVMNLSKSKLVQNVQ